MKRGSIAGPLVLIAIGLVFLLNNLRPDLVAWSSIGRYWPFLVILVGLVRLFEVLIDAGRGKPLGSRSFSGGAAAMLVVLCAFFWAISQPWMHWRLGRLEGGGIELFGEQYDYRVSRTAPAAGVTTLTLENLRGNVSINGGDSSDVEVEGRKSIRAYHKSAADDADRKSSIELVRDGSRLLLRSNDVRASDRSVSIDLDIKVPRGVNVEARSRSGDLTLTAIDGAVDVAGDRGNVRMTGIGGNAKVELSRGGLVRAVDLKGSLDVRGKGSDIQIENVAGQVTINGLYSGTLDCKNVAKPLRFESANGADVRVERIPGTLMVDLGDIRADNVVGPVRVLARSRDIEMENFSEAVEIDLERGDIQLKPGRVPLGKIDVHARNGNISLALPENAEFDLNATTARGEAQNDYGDAVKAESEGRSASLRGAAGHGPSIVASTDRGTIAVSKGVFSEVTRLNPREQVRRGIEDVKRQAEQARREARRQAEEARRTF